MISVLSVEWIQVDNWWGGVGWCWKVIAMYSRNDLWIGCRSRPSRYVNFYCTIHQNDLLNLKNNFIEELIPLHRGTCCEYPPHQCQQPLPMYRARTLVGWSRNDPTHVVFRLSLSTDSQLH